VATGGSGRIKKEHTLGNLARRVREFFDAL
jgi:hypothetical protein